MRFLLAVLLCLGSTRLLAIDLNGQRLEVEVKSATGRQSKAQRAFQKMIEKFGGLYVLARGPVELP